MAAACSIALKEGLAKIIAFIVFHQYFNSHIAMY